MTALNIISMVSICIGLISTSLGIFLSLKGNRKADIEETKKQVENDTRVNLKLDQIITNQNNQAAEITNVKTTQNAQNERIVKVEESVKQAHHRIDSVEVKLEGKN